MKKILSFLTAILFAGSMMAEVGSLYYTFLPYKPSSGAVSDYTKTGTMTIDGMNWTVPGNWYGNGALRLGGKSLDGVDRTIIAQDAMGSAISKIRIAHAGKTADAITLNSITVTTASDADFTENVTEKTVSDFTVAKNTKDTIDIVPAAESWATNSFYKFAFNFTNPNGSNYAFVVESILFYAYEAGGSTPDVVYSVAGSKALLGAEWNEKEGNEMTLDKEDGLYKLLCADVTLAGGTEYKFKIVTNHDWTNPNYPDQDKVLTVEKDGKYDVTITFNADTKDVAYVAEFKGGAVVEKHYLIVGDAAIANGENWNNAADINLMKSADEGLTYTLAVENAELAAETPYGYKVVEQGSWTEYFPNIGGDNAYFAVEAAGVYTITYTYTVATSQCVAITTKTGDIPGPVDPETPVDSMTVYYVNKAAWEAVNAFVWPAEGNAYKEWPGEAMTKQEEKINDLDVYAYTFPASYVNIIFNNGTAQTADLVWNADAPYYYDGVWYAKADIPAGGETPAADFTKPFVLKFNGTGESGKDASAAFTADVAAIFDAASAPYVASVETATKVYAGRPIADDNSSVKFGTTTAQGLLNFTLAQVIDVDSIIVNATQYGSNASKITVNGTEFALNAGNKVPQDCKITPEGKVSDISIAQSTSERLYLRNIRVYPKTSTPEPPTPGDTYYMKNNWEGGEWTWKEMTQDGDIYKLENVVFGGTGVNYSTSMDDPDPAWVPVDDILGDEIAAKDTVTFVLNPVKATVTATLIGKYQDGGDTPEPPTPGTVYYMKNNWEAGADWTWKAMTQDGEIYKLENVVFGGTGVNYNTAESDEGAAWVAVDDILGDEIAAKDTVTFVLDPVKATVTATLIGKYQDGGDTPEPPTPGTVYYMKNNWDGGEWTWKEMTQDGDIYKLENVVFGGYGVNYNTAESDEGAAWVPVDDILGDEIAAKDTVTFVLNPVKATVTATLIGKYQDGGDTPEPPTPGAVYYMKNNWDGGEWTWKEMTQDGDIYKLENVVFGGYGVNYSTSMEDLDPAWVALEDILGDEIAALDTVTFVLNPVKATVTATLIGKYVDPVTPPTPEEYVTLYFVNVDEWKNVYAYVWNDDYNVGDLAGWPGTQMTLTEDSVGDYAVYSFTFATKYNKVIFDNGSGGAGNQTSDMIWNAATPYYYDGIWYASLDDINPAAETKFYISGDMSLVGAGSVWDPKAIKSLEDSYTLHLTPGVYLLKISLDGTEATWKGFSDLSEITPGLTQWGANNAIAFTLAQEGDVVVTYKVVNEVVTFTVVGKFFTIEEGFYLMSMSKSLPALTAADKFAPNTAADGEYLLNTTLTEGDQIAVVMVANNTIIYYYYGENFYYVDANHAGATTIYFRPEGNAEWTETGGYFYVVPTGTTGIEETIAAGKAAKVLRNGQILILKGDKMYNVMGAVIR